MRMLDANWRDIWTLVANVVALFLVVVVALVIASAIIYGLVSSIIKKRREDGKDA